MSSLHLLKVEGQRNVVYIDYTNKDFHECVIPHVRRMLPGIWGAGLDSRVVRISVVDTSTYRDPDVGAGLVDIKSLNFIVWDQHNALFEVTVLWELASRPLNILHMIIERCAAE